MSKVKYYAKKTTAQKHLNENDVLCNCDLNKYFICTSYQEFLNIILSDLRPTFFECISDKKPVPIFFDIEIYRERNPEEFRDHLEIIQRIKSFVLSRFMNAKFVILESHSELKKSYHIIIRQTCFFKNVVDLKAYITSNFRDLIDHKIVDTSVYREGLFRTIYSSKPNESRPFIKSGLSDDFDDLESFVGNVPSNPDIIKDPVIKEVETLENLEVMEVIEPKQKRLTDANKRTIRSFLQKNYNYNEKSIREILINREFNCIIIALDDHFCHNIDREHISNNQYIIIDTFSAKRKCHDIECKDHKFNEIKMTDYPKELNELIKNVLKMNKQELELIDHAIQECKDYITENFDESIETIHFDKNEMVFRGNASNNGSVIKLNGKCRECLIEHQITNTGYCLKCIVCKSIYPKNQVIPVDDRYKNLNNFWMNYSQLVNNGTVNININNNYYTNEQEFNCDIRLDHSIFKNKELTKLYNQVLDGHKVIKISELISTLEIDFKYANGEWYYFNGKTSEGGGIWKMDKESLEFRKRIVNLSHHLNRIQSFYENKSNADLIKNIKSLINKLHKPGFEDEIIKGAKMYYNDEDFMKNLNSKKHLVPFTNGVFDLITGQFRQTTKEDYINLTVNYPNLTGEGNPEVYRFLREVLPNEGVRDYVLKKMSECLNGDIPNTYFLMFIGDTGANGKSQLLNLMKLAMGDFGEKVEVTLLTRKRNNANEANSEKIKLLNKRFAFLSEPEDGEKINIGLLKELTGSEEIVARGLYQDSLSFVMEAKLFLACNELPEIKGEDTALWRRIRVIDFPSRFVDDPKEPHEYKIDRTLPSKMREDITWRQTFMKILLEYYYRDIKEPMEVLLKTNEYRQENTEFYNWLDDHLEENEEGILQLADVCDLYLGKRVGPRILAKYRKEIEKYIKEKYKKINHNYEQFWIGPSDTRRKYKGWQKIRLIS